MSNIQRKTSKQAGSVLALVGFGLVPILAAVALSIDIGFVYNVRAELQNTVDAAALAGAQGLIFSQNRATQLAKEVANQNKAGGASVTLADSEITFPKANQVRVEVTRPARTFFASMFRVNQVNVRVRATAAVAPVNSVSGGPGGGGMRPFVMLDQFGHGPLCVPPNDADISLKPHGAFKTTPHTWNGVTVQSDLYKSPFDEGFDGMDLSREGDCSMVTGFIAFRDITGERIQLKHGAKDGWITPGNYGPGALGSTGASAYEYNIGYGYNGTISIGDILQTEPGNMTSPTRDGVKVLINQDPTARMVRTSNGWEVISDSFPPNESPRIVPIPLYSVEYRPEQGRSDFRVANIASFFIENSTSDNVFGYFMVSRAKTSKPGEPVKGSGKPTGGRFMGSVLLVE